MSETVSVPVVPATAPAAGATAAVAAPNDPAKLLETLLSRTREFETKAQARERAIAEKEATLKAREGEYTSAQQAAKEYAELQARIKGAKGNPGALLEMGGITKEDVAEWALQGDQMSPAQITKMLESRFSEQIGAIKKDTEEKIQALITKQQEAEAAAKKAEEEENASVIDNWDKQTLASLMLTKGGKPAAWDDEKGFGEDEPEFPLTILSDRASLIPKRTREKWQETKEAQDPKAFAKEEEDHLRALIFKASKIPSVKGELLKLLGAEAKVAEKAPLVPPARASVAGLGQSTAATATVQRGETKEDIIARIEAKHRARQNAQ